MKADTLNLGLSKYSDIVGIDKSNRDDDGYFVLKPSAHLVDEQVGGLTTDISSLEEKLKMYREKKASAVKYQKTDEYKESKKELKSKKKKKQKETLLHMVFNNADAAKASDDDEEDSEENENYKDSPKAKARARNATKNKDTTLDTTYGKRFSAVVSMLYDTVNDFDSIAIDLENELKNPQYRGKTMYRSSQIGNLIAAKDKKLSAIKEIAAVAKTVSDLEYKKEKDRSDSEGSNTSKAIASIGAKFLRGGFDDYEDKKKKKKDKKGTKGFNAMGTSDDDDEDDETGSISNLKNNVKSNEEQKELANEFANSLLKHKDEISFTPHEKHIDIEGKYVFVVAADSLDPENNWHFIAVDTNTGKEIKDFKDNYKDLYPKKKACRMSFDLAKLRCTDRNTSKRYKLVLYN